MVTILATTALRISEVAGLRVGDVDLGRGLLHVFRQTYPGRGGLVRHGLRHTALTWMADAGVDLHILQRVAGHQDPAVTSRYLHPDTQAVLDAGTAFSAWWSGSGPERPRLGLVDGGRSGA